MELASDEGEALAEFEEEFFQMAEQAQFEFPLAERFSQREEVEDVGVFQHLFGQVGLRGWQSALEVVDGLALAFVGVTLDLKDENVATPAVLDGLAHIPEARGEVFDLLPEHHVVTPGQLCNKLLRKPDVV